MTYVERPTSLIKPPLPKPRAQTNRRIYGNLNERLKLFQGLGQLSEDAAESVDEENLESLRQYQPKAITPNQKRWTQIDTTDQSQWNGSKPSPRAGGSLKQTKLSPVPAPRKSLSPTSPNGVLLSPTYAVHGNKNIFKPTPKPRVRSVTPEFSLDEDFNKVLAPISLSLPSRQSPIHPPSSLGRQSPTQSESSLGGQSLTQSESSLGGQSLTQSESSLGGQSPTQSESSLLGQSPTQSESSLDRQSPIEPPSSPSEQTPIQQLSSPSRPSAIQQDRKKSDLVIYSHQIRKQSDSVIYSNQNMAHYYHTVHPPSEDRPRAQTGMDNKFTIAEEDNPPHRPRSRSDFDNNGRTKEEQANVRQSVLELAQAFGDLKPAKKERPKTFGYPLSNGHSNKLMSSSPNLLQDQPEPVQLKKSPQKLMNSSPDLLNDHPDEPAEGDSHRHEGEIGQRNKRLSKTLANFNPILLPTLDPKSLLKKTGDLKSKPKRPESTPVRPLSQIPPKPKRTYEQDIYARNKNIMQQQQQKGTSKLNLNQTKSAAPSTGRKVSPLTIPSSIKTSKKHVYDDVLEVKDGEDEKGYLLPSPQTSPVAPKRLVWPIKTIQANNESTNRPSSHAPSRRSRLQRSKRMERSRSTEDLSSIKDYNISGEYALPETVVPNRDKNGKSEYSEVYMARSSSEESIFKKVHDPVEDAQGYSVPGSHLWNEVPVKDPAKGGIKNMAVEQLLPSGEEKKKKNLSYKRKYFSRRRRDKEDPYGGNKEDHSETPIVPLVMTTPPSYSCDADDEGALPPSPSFLRRKESKTMEETHKHMEGSRFRQRSKQIHMRHKIQSAFSRQRGGKLEEEDTLSVTSEDSDIEVNEAGNGATTGAGATTNGAVGNQTIGGFGSPKTVLKKRLTHVRAVKKRTSAYCSLEWYRKTMVYSKLYEYVIVVSLQYNKETRRHEPCEIKRFPHEISDSQNDKLKAIPLFCFPDAFKWAKVDNYQSESYSFVLTSVDGSRLYGYNRRLLPPGNGARLPEVYCVMSPIGCGQLYNELLDEIEKRREVSLHAVELLLRTARDHPFPKPGERLRIKMPMADTITKPLILHRPQDSRLEQMSFECLFDSLDVSKVIQVFASLLLERRVVMCSSKLSKLSSCSQAIASLLYPFAWQHVYVPVLPERLIDMCCSPTPYIMGMLSLCIPKLDDLPGLDEVIVVDLDSRDFYFVVGDEETILPKKLYVGLQRALSFAQKGGSDNVNDEDKELAKDPDSRNAMISEAFIHFFVETCGHYSNHFTSQFDGTLKFDRNGFLNAIRSRSLRRFLDVFTETQMFSLFIQEKETESEGICQGMFERRVKMWEREKANNATFSTKMKKIVKDSGIRFALPRSRHKPTK